MSVARRMLAIALNKVSPTAYGGWDGKLVACEYDANSYLKIAAQLGFDEMNVILTRQAKWARIATAIARLAKKTKPGDLAVITYSGHGAQLTDVSGDEADDRKDEAPCFYDGPVIDDKIRNLFALFPKGSTVVYITDSCHSASQARAFADLGLAPRDRIKAAPRWAIKAAIEKNDPRLGSDHPPAEPMAAIVTFSACRDNQVAMDGDGNGLFTGSLVTAKKAGPRLTWRELRNSVNAMIGDIQEPCISGPEEVLNWTAFEIGA